MPHWGLVVVGVEPHCTDGCCARAFAAIAVDAEHLNVVELEGQVGVPGAGE